LFTTTASNRALFLRASSLYQFETNLRRGRQLEGIAKALKIGRASVYRVLGQAST
jgi:DNA invertase Pin-like site-specific DNA recombinase